MLGAMSVLLLCCFKRISSRILNSWTTFAVNKPLTVIQMKLLRIKDGNGNGNVKSAHEISRVLKAPTNGLLSEHRNQESGKEKRNSANKKFP